MTLYIIQNVLIFSGTSGALTGTVAGTYPAFVSIPGSSNVIFAGSALSDMLPLVTPAITTGTTMQAGYAGQTSDGSVLATGHRFVFEVYSIAATQTDQKGFSLHWRQVPCNSAGSDKLN